MKPALSIRGLTAATAFFLASCDSSSKPADDAVDGALPPGARDAAQQGGDSGRAQDQDARVMEDASNDASTDGGTASLRAQVCGTATDFPAPLPADVNARKAQRVGTENFGFLEGPVWIAEQGVLLFSDMDFGGGDTKGPPAKIRRLKPPATFDQFVGASNGNGLALSPEGALLAATHDNQGLSAFDLKTAARVPFEVRSDGKRLNSPNDLAVRSDGAIYLTDPDWQLGARTSETKRTGVYRIAPPLQSSGTNQALLVDGTLNKPNGVALSPDEKTLYVGSLDKEIWKYPVREDGSLGARTKFAETGASDGFAVDCAGNLYVTSDTVEVFAPSGEKLGDITVADTPSNAAFGGEDRKTLYITAGARLYAIKLNVPGFPY